MNKNNVVKIHGKEYVTVAGRLQMAHDVCKKRSITTEVLPIANQIVVKATVTIDKGIFTGISAANPTKTIEKQSPYEVAETSAVGRALGLAGFGAEDGIATADEIIKVQTQSSADVPSQQVQPTKTIGTSAPLICTCGTSGKYHALDCPARSALTMRQ